jgi:hypothetical protein
MLFDHNGRRDAIPFTLPLLSRKPSPKFSHKFAEIRSLNLDA